MSRTPPKIKLPAFSSHQKTYSFPSPSLSRSSPFVLAEAQESHRSPLSLAAHVRAIGRSHERHVLTASRTRCAPLQAGIASAAAVVQWSLSLAFACPPLPGIHPQLSSQVALSNTDRLTPPPSLALSGFRVVSRNKNQRPTTAALLSDQCLLTFMPCACTEWRRFRSPGVPQQKAPSSPCAAAGLGAPRGGFWQLRPGHTLSRA